MKDRIDYTRMYLVINLIDEDYPMMIKLGNQPHRSITSMFYPLVEADFNSELVSLKFYTNHLVPVDTIDGVRARVFYKDTYGHRFCELVIDANRLKSYRLEMLDDCSSYIKDCQFHYAQKYGVSYGE